MRKHNRFLPMLLAALMAAGVFAGCGDNGGSSQTSSDPSSSKADSSGESSAAGAAMEGNLYLEGVPIVKEQETYKIAVMRHTLCKADSFNDKIAWQQAEADTNIHIEWIEVVSGTEGEKVPIMLASDLPDAFLNLLGESHVAKNMTQLVALNDLLEKYAPNIVEQYATIPNMDEMMKFPDGNQYTLAVGLQVSHDDDGQSMFFMNMKWLEKVGKEVPTTTDELYDVLKAFKDGDPNGNGQADEIPLELCENNWAAGIMYYAGPWGITGNYKIVDGKFTPTVNTQAYRDFIDYFHKLAVEGLIDVEGFSQTNQQFYAKLKEYVCGAYGGWTPQSNFDEETAKEYDMVLPLTAPGYEGQTVKIGEWSKFRGNRTGFAITTACKSPETLLRWWDYLSSDTKRKWTIAYGEEGKCWEMDESGQVWSLFPEATADYTRENMKYTEGSYGCMPLILESEMEKNDAELRPTSVYRSNWSEECKPYYEKEVLPMRFVTPEKTNEKAMIETDLNDYIKNFLATSVINGVTDESWNAHLQQLEALGINEWVQWYQDFIDGKF